MLRVLLLKASRVVRWRNALQRAPVRLFVGRLVPPNTGSRRRKTGRPAGKGPLSAHLDFLVAAVEDEPDLMMPELAERLLQARGIVAHTASLSRLLCRAGFTYKKTADGVGVRSR